MKHPKPVILISACIEHSPARYDGTTISCQTVKDMWDFVQFIPICPEMSIGMPAPRDTIRLTQKKGENIKMVSSTEGIDFTEAMLSFSKKYVETTLDKSIDGFILKAKSPSCGTDKVKIYDGAGKSQPFGSTQNGIFASEIVDYYHEYPIESERRLSNFNIREHFYIRIFTTARFRRINVVKMKGLVEFHSIHKYLFMTYNQKIVKTLGNIVANHDNYPIDEVYKSYYDALLMLLSKPATRPKKINVLTHIYGYFKSVLSDAEKAYYLETQNDYLQGHIPYSSLLRILESFSIRFNDTYLMNQVIFDPYPKQLTTELDSGKKI